MATEKWVADAHQLLIEIERIYEDHYSHSYNQCVHDIFNAMRRIVRRNATFRTVEVVHARWEKHQKPVYMCGNLYYRYECSNCGKDIFVLCAEDRINANYCDKCGADMREKMDGDGNG